jgi:hypothetical protein
MRRLWPVPLVVLVVGLVGCVPEELPPPAKDDISPLVAQLGDRDFRTREKATRELTAKGWDAVPAMQKALDKATEPEVAERLEKALTAITKLNWYAKADEAVAAATKTGRPILMFSTIGDPDGFA